MPRLATRAVVSARAQLAPSCETAIRRNGDGGHSRKDLPRCHNLSRLLASCSLGAGRSQRHRSGSAL